MLRGYSVSVSRLMARSYCLTRTNALEILHQPISESSNQWLATCLIADAHRVLLRLDHLGAQGAEQSQSGGKPDHFAVPGDEGFVEGALYLRVADLSSCQIRDRKS